MTRPGIRTLLLLSIVIAVAVGGAQHAAGSAALPAHSSGWSQLPLAARGAVAAGIASHDGRYRVTPAARGLTARNPAQGLRLGFSPAGAVVSVDGQSLQLALGAVGRDGVMRQLGSVRPRVSASNRVVYRRAALAEWYANSPLGLEQGFALDSRPAGRGALTFVVGLTGPLAIGARQDGQAVSLGPLVYRGLVVTDARGRSLPARLQLVGDHIVIDVNDRAARYPVRVDPLLQLAELTASDGAANDNYGYSVAVSGDTIVVGAPGHTGGSNQGAVYVFTKPSGGWINATETAELTASDGAAGDQLGFSVAISGDTIAAGANRRTVGGNVAQGAVYVFTKPSGGWTNATETAELTASDGAANDSLGISVAVSGDTIAAGARLHQVGSNLRQGAVYVFAKPGGGWVNATETAELTASDGAAGDTLGRSVAVSGDTIAAGAPGRYSRQGAVYVFTEPSGGWTNVTETAELTASDGAAGDRLGNSVALNGDTIAAGAPWRQGLQGAVYVFTKPGGGWANGTETAELTASDGASGDFLGYGLAVSGNTIAAGAFSGTVSGNAGQGAVYVFAEPGSGWTNATETAKLTALDGAGNDNLGFGVDMSGATIVAGAPGHNASQGAAYIFAPTMGSPSISTSQQPASAAVGSPIADTATVSGGYSPTGSVTFSLYDNASAAGTPLYTDTEPLSSGSATSAPYTPTATGTDYWVATYNGDAYNNAAISGSGDEPVTVTTASPTISTIQQPAASVTLGTAIADQATVSNGYQPTGTVTFNLYDNPSGTGTPLYTDTEPLASGSATSATYTPTATGAYYWVATYNGDAYNNAVSSGTADEPVSVTSGGPSGTATIAFQGNAVTLDPAFAYDSSSWQLLYATCANLVSYPDDPAPAGYQLVPDAATALPTVSSDGLVYRFTIRPGLRFSDGSSVTAASFARAIERLAANQGSSPGYQYVSEIAGVDAYSNGSASSISGVQASGNQLQITLTQTDGAFAAKLSMPFFCAVPELTPLTQSNSPLPSAGPYYVSSYTPGQGLSLKTNPYYTGPRPAGFAQINAVFEPAHTSYLQALSGSVDYTAVALGDQASANASYGPGSPAAAAGHQQYFTTPNNTIRYLMFNTSHTALQDRNVRQAIATAISRTQLASDLHETPTDDFVTPAMPGYVDRNNFNLSGNVAAAQALMEASGYGPDNHLQLTLATPSSSSFNGYGADITSELASIYIDVTWYRPPCCGYYSFLENPAANWDLAYVGWQPDYADWSGVLNPLLDGRTMTAGSVGADFSHWNDAATNSALDYASALPAGDARNTAFEQLATGLAQGAVPMAAVSQVASHEFFSSKMGCIVYQPVYGLDLTRLCSANPVTAGDTYTQPGTVSSSTPVLAGVTASADGAVSVVTASSSSNLSGYDVVGKQLLINAPNAPDTAHPLSITLTIDAGTLVAAGLTADTVAVLRDGVAVPACNPNDGTVSNGDDPCVTSRTTDGSGNAVITILSTHASVWNSGKPDSTPPVLNSVSLGSSQIDPGGSTTISVSASSDAVFAEFYVDTDLGPGNNIPLGGSAGSFVSPPYGDLLPAGKHTIGVRVRDAAGNWSPVTVVHLQVGKADQTITFGALSDHTYGDAAFDPGATASSGLAVSYGASGACSIVSGQVHITGAGSCTVTASQAGDSQWSAAPDVQQSFSIATAPLTITANDQQKAYGQTLDLGSLAFTPSGLVGSDAILLVTLTSPGAASGADAGSYAIVPSAAVPVAGTDLSNYSITYVNGTLTVGKADQSISFPAIGGHAYGDADFDPDASASSGLAVSYGASGNCSIVSGKVHITGAGSCTVTALQGGNSDWNAASNVQQSFTIGKASLTITANNQSKTYGQTLSLGTSAFTPSGLVGSDSVSSVTLTSPGAASSAHGGTYAIVPSSAVAGVGTDFGNYTVSYVNGTLNVNKASQTITFPAIADRTWGAADFDPGAISSVGLAVSYGTVGPCSIVGGKVHITGAGSCTVTASQAGNTDYNAAPNVQRSFLVGQATLSIHPSDRQKVFHFPLALGTSAFATSGLVNGDSVSAVTLTSAGAGAGAAPGSYAIVASSPVAGAGTNLGNYAIHYVGGTLKVLSAGIVGLDGVSIVPLGGKVDSFDSSLGAYSGSNKGSAALALSNGTVSLGQLTFWGGVISTQADVRLTTKKATVFGDVTAGTSVTNPGVIAGTVTQNAPSPAIAAPTVASCSPFSNASGLSGGSFALSAGNLTVVSGTVTLANDTYCFHNVVVGTGARLRVAGPVTINLTGRWSSPTAKILNTTNVPSNLRINSSYAGTNGISMDGGSHAYMTLVAPATGVAIVKDAFFGRILARTLQVTGNGTTIHEDVH